MNDSIQLIRISFTSLLLLLLTYLGFARNSQESEIKTHQITDSIYFLEGGNVQGMIKTLDKILELSDSNTKIIPGHGQLATRQEVLEFTNMLKTIRDRVQAGIDEKKSLEEIIATNPINGFEERGVPKERFIKSVYNSL